MAAVTYIKCETSDGFVVVDLDGAPVATGVIRVARKVLLDGAWNLARTTTYAAASFGLRVSGASGAVNADGDTRDTAVATVIAELAARSEPPVLAMDPGKGCRPDELTPLADADPRSDARSAPGLLAEGIVAAAQAGLGYLDGATVCIEPGTVVEHLADAFATAGATVVEATDGLATDCDVLCAGSKPGVIDHDNAPSLNTRVVVPAGPLPVTARGLAVARRAGIAVLPDFVALAAPLIAAFGPADGATPADQIAAAIVAVADHPEGHFLGACERAEEFLGSWASIPFGRPLP